MAAPARPAVSHRSLQRSLGALSFGMVRAMESRKELLGKTALRERDQHFQIPIVGRAPRLGISTDWNLVDITFRVGFVDATGQRDSPYTLPQVAFGSVITSENPVIVNACVIRWKFEEDDADTGAVIGARIAVAALSATAVATAFKGTLHVTFTGYGAPNDAEQEET